MKHFFLIPALFVWSLLVAQAPPRPEPPRLYNNLSKDFPQFLSDEEVVKLEAKLEQFSNETSNQIAVVIVDDFGGQDANAFATQIGNQWGLGMKGKNNGVVVLVKPTQRDGGRDLAIAVGYGLEGAIPDLFTKRVREDYIVPNLKEGNNYAALEQGTDVLMKKAKGEFNERDKRHKVGRNGNGKVPTVFLIIIVIIVLIIMRLFRGGGRGGGFTFGGGRTTYWGSGMGGSSWGSGGSWGGGSSGGGWGGFGGGSFGGGGSSGKW